MKKFEHSIQSQLNRLLVRLRKGPISTIEARHELDIIHAPARVYELRNQGYNIITHWSYEQNPGGGHHRIAKYVLRPGKFKKREK